jgi:hypothetical protein
MTTATTAAPEFFLAKCHEGHVTHYTAAERADVMAPWSSAKWSYTKCAVAIEGGYKGRCSNTAAFTPIRVKVTRTECGPRCTGAVGPACDCKCGGANHGGGH